MRKSKAPVKLYVEKIIELYIAGEENAAAAYGGVYTDIREEYDFSKKNHDLKFIRRCAEQDFMDGEDACCFPEIYQEVMA